MISYSSAAEVEELVAEIVRAVQLDAYVVGGVEVDHRQGSQATWTEGELPATAALPATARHLEFTATIEGLEISGVGQTRGTYEVRGDLAVVFWYRLRAGRKRVDARDASRLAANVCAELLHRGAPGVTVSPAVPYRPGRPVGEWLPIEVRCVVVFDLVL